MNTYLRVPILLILSILIVACEGKKSSEGKELSEISTKENPKLETAESLSLKVKELQIIKLTEEAARIAQEKIAADELVKKKEETDKLLAKIKIDSIQKLSDYNQETTTNH